MTRVPGWLRFTSRATKQDWIRLVVRFGLASLLIFIVGFITLVEVTSQPVFCGNACHIMKPYYESWQTSAHKDISCVECHMAPGIRGTIRAKMQGIAQVAKYFTGTAGTRPGAEVDDASCLREGCHETRLLQGKVDFNGIKFDHTPHLTQMRRGKKLRCTSCHSQVVMGEHLKVTTSTCILCHFKNRPTGDPVAGCQGCHSVPTDTITLPGGRVYIHKDVVDRGVECVSCHASLTTGDGFVPRSRCFVCHNFPIDDLLDTPDFLHSKHVTEHKVECMACHEEITHGYESKRRIAKLECGQCHSGVHAAEKNLAEGTASSILGETEPRVGPMLSARVECIACHTNVVENDSRDTYEGSTRHGQNSACIKCHGEMAKNLFPGWKAFFTKRLGEVERAIASSHALTEDRARARDMFERVKHGRAVHNPRLAHDLLEQAERIARGTKAPPPPPQGPAVSSGNLDCRFCHLKPPAGPLRFDGATFLHAPHTERLGLACEKCHDPAPPTFPQAPHGKVHLTKENCVSCHHWQRENCGACHGTGPASPVDFRPPGMGGVSRESTDGRSDRGILFPHAKHTAAGVDCKTCHMKTIRGERQLKAASIEDCQTCHHRAGAKAACTACHKMSGSPAPIPEFVGFRDAHLPHRVHIGLGIECRDCHKTAGRGTQINPICNTCHHEDGMKPNCQACHGNGPTQLVPSKWKPFPHAKHIPLGLSCGDCHTKADPTKVEAPCETCHEDARPLAPPASSDTPSGTVPAGEKTGQ